MHRSFSCVAKNNLRRHVGRIQERFRFSLACFSPFDLHRNSNKMLYDMNRIGYRMQDSQRFRLHSLPSYKIARKQFQGGETSQFPWRDGFELSKPSPSSDANNNEECDDCMDYRNEYRASMIIDVLGPLISEERKERIRKVIDQRCFQVLPVIEQPHDWGNVAAVCRSADAMGLGALHIIRDANNDAYKQSTRTSGGADKWLDIQLHTVSNASETQTCLENLKKRGFRIVATCLGTDKKKSKPPSDIDWTHPTAVIFGNELEGIRQETVDMADDICEIPIDGFVESYNISVAASLIFWEARRIRLEKRGSHGDVSDEEKEILEAVYYLRNKGQFVSYASELLRRNPPDWQVYRGDWGGKDFVEQDEYVDTRFQRKMEAKKMCCHLWDGEKCYGEEYLYSGERKCRFAAAHVPGKSTLNMQRFEKQCAMYGKVIQPEVLKANK